MKVGIPLFRLRNEHMAAVSRRAEQLGFESVWVPEHLVFPTEFKSRYPYSADGVPPITPDSPHLDPLVVLTHLAAATSRIRLGTMVASPNFRHPVTLAKEAMTLDHVSAGRFTLGLGAGGTGFDATALGQEPWTPRERADRFGEFVPLLDRLLTEDGFVEKLVADSAHEARNIPGC